jgi:putative flippase GtrA
VSEHGADTASQDRGALRRFIDLAQFLRTPESGLLGQGVRFVIAGGIVTVVYLTLTIALADLFGAPFQVALVVGWAAGITTHFSLQRFFVWVHHEDFSLSLRHQLARYLFLAVTQYVTTVLATVFLPSALHLPVTAVFLGWTVTVTVINFLLFRLRIFHPEVPEEAEDS